jgi:hypothetical protein
MAKIDKEALKKHKFWIGVGAFVLLWLIAIIIVEASGDDKPKKDYEAKKKAIEGAKQKGPKTVAYQTPWNEHGKKFRDHKDKIWAEAWAHQAEMYEWPAEMAVKPDFPEQPFGADPNEDVDNRSKFINQYDYQFTGLETGVYPVEFAGGFNNVFPKQKWKQGSPPTREEIWLAQEDFWVRKQLLAAVKNALDTTAFFTEVKIDPKDDRYKLPPEEAKVVEGRRLFRNANWELDLKFAKRKEGRGLILSNLSTIKNISVTRKTLLLANPETNKGLPFRLFQVDTGAVRELRITGEPLAYEQKTKFPDDIPVEPVKLTEPFYVEQKLDWDISPIRRIDELRIGQHSHRTFVAGLKMREDLAKLDGDAQPAEGSGSSTGTGTGSTPGVPPVGGMTPGSAMPKVGGASGMSSMGGNMPKGMGPGGASGGDDKGKLPEKTRVNEIDRNRYMHVTPQCRHLPIGMRLVVDQGAIQDILAAVANSPLRIQVTQVSFHYVNNIKRGEAGADSAPAMGGKPGAPPMSPFGSRGPGGPGGMRPPGPMGAPPGPKTGAPNVGSAGGPPGPPSPKPGVGGSAGGPPGGGSARYGGSSAQYGGQYGRSGAPGMGSAYMPNRPVGRFSDEMGPSGAGKPTGTAGDPAGKPPVRDTARLVELNIYGVACLYERFRTDAPAGSAKPANPANPANPTPKK